MRALYVFLSFFIILNCSHHLHAQSIEYEELAQIPLTAIDNAALAPNGDLFVISREEVYNSVDDGQSWLKYENFPEGFRPRDIYFFEDGTVVISGYYESSSANLMLQDNEWQELFPEYFYSGSLRILENTVYYVKSDTVYRSLDKGETFDFCTRESTSGRIYNIHSHGDSFMLMTYDSDSLTSFRSFAIEVFDQDFNYIKTNALPIPEENTSYASISQGPHSLFYQTYRGNVIYTPDNGETFIHRNIGRFGYDIHSIFNNRFYFNRGDTIFSVQLDQGIATNMISPFDTLLHVEYGVDHGKYFIYQDRNYFRTKNIQNGDEMELYDFPFKNGRLRKLEIDHDDNIYASSLGFIFKSSDRGLSWQKHYGSYQTRINSWTLSEEGGLSIGHSRDNYSQDSSAIYIHPNGEIDLWKSLTSNIEVFSIENGRHRVIALASDCDFGFTQVYTSRDGGTFQADNLGDDMCLSGNMDATYYKEKIYLFGDDHSDDGIYNTIDVKNDYNIEKIRGVTAIGNDFNYYSQIKDNGEIFVYPKVNLFNVEDDQRFPVYYSPDVAEVDIEPVGRAPRGQLIQTDNNDRSFVIQQNGTHYIRPSSIVDYEELEVSNKSFDSFIDGAFDSQNRLVIAVGDGRILRAVTDGLSTSVVEEEAFVFSVSPNPAHEVLHVVLEETQSYSCTISNVSGAMVHQSEHHGRTINININGLDNGIYFLSVVDSEGRRVTRKFVKM